MFLARLLLLCVVLKCLFISCLSAPPPPPPPPKHKSAAPKYQMFCDVSYRGPDMSVLSHYCTALASSNDTIESIANLDPLRNEKTIFMRYSTSKTFDQWKTALEDEATIDQFTVTIVNQKINYLCFDHLYELDDKDKVDSDFTTKIIGFLSGLKSKNPLVKLGIAVPKQSRYLKNAFDLTRLDPHVDFYLIKTNNYRQCEHHLVDDDNRRTQDEDIKGSIEALQDEQYKLEKVLLLMDINVYSHDVMKFTIHPSNHYATLSFTYLCTQKYSKYRALCYDSLQQFYVKSKMAKDNNMMGLYVQYGNVDDVKGDCHCMDNSQPPSASYPVLNVLSKALMGQDGGDLLHCNSWAKPPNN